jgi:hypothetical protein
MGAGGVLNKGGQQGGFAAAGFAGNEGDAPVTGLREC